MPVTKSGQIRAGTGKEASHPDADGDEEKLIRLSIYAVQGLFGIRNKKCARQKDCSNDVLELLSLL